MSGQYPPPPPPPNQPPNQPPTGGQPGQPSWGGGPPSYQPTQGYTPQSYGGYGGGPTGPNGPYQGYPQGGGSGGGGGKGLLITTVVVGVVAVIAAITTLVIVLTGGDDDSDDTANDDSSQSDEPTTDPTDGESEDPPATEDTPTEEPSTEAPPPPDGAVPLNTPSKVGNYTVTVSDYNKDADQAIADANQFNEPPSGRYVLVTMNAVYDGSGKGSVLDLHMTLVTSDGTEYEDYDCGAVEPKSSITVSELPSGQDATFETCFDIPIASVDGATMKVNQDFDDATEITYALE